MISEDRGWGFSNSVCATLVFSFIESLLELLLELAPEFPCVVSALRTVSLLEGDTSFLTTEDLKK